MVFVRAKTRFVRGKDVRLSLEMSKFLMKVVAVLALLAPAASYAPSVGYKASPRWESGYASEPITWKGHNNQDNAAADPREPLTTDIPTPWTEGRGRTSSMARSKLDGDISWTGFKEGHDYASEPGREPLKTDIDTPWTEGRGRTSSMANSKLDISYKGFKQGHDYTSEPGREPLKTDIDTPWAEGRGRTSTSVQTAATIAYTGFQARERTFPLPPPRNVPSL